MIKTQNFTMKSDFKNAKKYMKVLSNILFMNSLPLTCDAICSKLYRDREYTGTILPDEHTLFMMPIYPKMVNSSEDGILLQTRRWSQIAPSFNGRTF